MNFKRITVNDLINHLKISRDNTFKVDTEVRLTFADISFIIERLKGGKNGRN